MTSAVRSAGPSGIVKHSISIAGHRTSISLERAFWEALRTIAEGRGQSIAAIVADIDAQRRGTNLSSAIRVYVLRQTQEMSRPEPLASSWQIR